MKLTDVIRRPLVTEKTTAIREGDRTLVFQVAPNATKVDIKRAVEKLLGSKVESVRMLPSNRVSARDVMDTRRVVLTRAALEKLQEALG